MAVTTQLQQDCDTFPERIGLHHFHIRNAYMRSADSQTWGDRGQDYLVYACDTDWLHFVLCDGVSQSFFGDLAARLLGDSLQAWLSEMPAAVLDEEVIQSRLQAHLMQLTRPATLEVEAFELPEGVSPLLRDVLEKKRALGSEATFALGRIDLPGDTLPRGRLLLAWMGDSRLRIWNAEREFSARLGDRFFTAQRWSSRIGPVGDAPNVYLSPLLDEQGRLVVSRCLAYTDGISALDAYSKPVSDEALRTMMEESHAAPASDDICLIEIDWHWRPESSKNKSECPQPAERPFAGDAEAEKTRPLRNTGHAQRMQDMRPQEPPEIHNPATENEANEKRWWRFWSES